MHTDEDYESSIEEENEYSDFYNSSYETTLNNRDKKNKKGIIIVILLLLVLIALAIVLLFVFKKERNVEFNLGLENINGDSWAKENVTINVEIPDETNLKSIKYTINCLNDCDYVDVVDKKIVISNIGSSIVTVIATSIDNIENKKDITVKIDNIAPELILSPQETEIKAFGPITVCAICKDNESGCKTDRVCKDYAESSKNQILEVEDNAGNKKTSSKFNVTIGSNSVVSTTSPSCELSVSKSGLITATYKNADAYFGFSSNYTGSNATTKQVDVSKDNETETVNYYVKSGDGKTGTCSIEVKASSCNCLYRGDDKKCYKTFVKTINNPNSKECKDATRKTNTNCSFYKDEGVICTYSKVVTK